MWVVSRLAGVADTTTARVTTIGLGTGGHGSTADAITTGTAALAAEAAESLGVLVDAGPVAVAGPVVVVPVAVAGPVAAVVADDCSTQG
ncbi:uncharacterized protein METZ01_LOCUS286577 [marine metagenome]|uniref:Uncharacterized protein n=1 Tax=marine metagenome TaxID=408172 RepID=A0A382LCC4_9ZZZZ